VLQIDALVDVLRAAGLRGRGGAAFPAATKLVAVAAGRAPRVVIANGAEGEPASGKDEALLAGSPHLVLDGLVLAARALRAREAIIAVERTRPRALRAVAAAIDERTSDGYDGVRLRIVPVPGRYVAGEESALVHLVDGGEAKPTVVPPRPFDRGVGGRPTLVQNVETLAHIALVARHGPEWFRQVGTFDEPGSTLLTISGAVRRPGVLEVSPGACFDTVIDAAGGEVEPVGAYLVGGFYGTWIRRDDLASRPLSTASLRGVGGFLGAGVLVAMPAAVCGLAETARVMGYLAEESAGQCGSCVHGLRSIADRTHELAHRQTGASVLDDLDRWSGMVVGRGACRLPDGAVRFLSSARRAFAAEVRLHQQGRCSATRRDPVLPLPGRDRDWSWR
jgi:NADH:ubiquinone oxidoreductase subunit F (NADH-binding)